MSETQKTRGSNQRFLVVTVAVLLVAAVGGGIAYYRYRTGTSESTPAKSASTGAPLPPGAEVSFPASVQPRSVLNIPAPINGVLDRVDIEPGQFVFEGQLLGRITNVENDNSKTLVEQEREKAELRVSTLEGTLIGARLEASRADADAARAESEYTVAQQVASRQQMLYSKKATARLTYEKAMKDLETKQTQRETLRDFARQQRERLTAMQKELEEARTALAGIEAKLETATAAYDAGDVLAPMDGTVFSIDAKPGEEVQAETRNLFSLITEPGMMKVTVEPEPPVLERIAAGDEAQILVLELSATYPGEITSVEGGVVTIEFYSPDSAVKPGLAAVVKLRVT